MTPSDLRPEVVADRAAWTRAMLDGIRALPLTDLATFEADPRNFAAAESYLRRALEALLDLGRHVLAKGFGRAAAEYKEIADALVELGVLDRPAGLVFREMAGYRNRLVHFYDAVGQAELFSICAHRLGDVETVLEMILAWVGAREVPEERPPV